jgi:LuxR family transcriptional regulator, positive regulator of biofilm formation
MNIHDIFVVGSNSLQNELIASILKEQTGIPCQQVKTLEEMAQNGGGGEKLALCDVQDTGVEGLLRDFGKVSLRPPPIIGLFNVPRGEGAEEMSVERGVRAIFYQGESFTHFFNGVAAVLEGQMWVSRRVIARCLTENNGRETSPNPNILSSREKEILLLVAAGATNEEVADRLFISSHTVKNHLYNLCKKINAGSRLQAALWASKNL